MSLVMTRYFCPNVPKGSPIVTGGRCTVTGVTTHRVSKKEAVANSRKSAKTFDRWRKDGKFDTQKNLDGEWQVSVASLIESGFWDNSTGPDPAQPAVAPVASGAEQADSAEVAELKERVAKAEEQVNVLTAEKEGLERLVEQAKETQRALESADQKSDAHKKHLERELARTQAELSRAQAKLDRTVWQKIFGLNKPKPPMAELPPAPPADEPAEAEPTEPADAD